MALSDNEAQRLLKDVDNIRHYLFGNGKEGLDEVVRKNTTAIAAIQTAGAKMDGKLDALKDSIDALRQERRTDNDRREGSKATLNWIKWGLGVILTLVVIGGSLGLYQTRSQWLTVQEQLRNIPSIPE